MIELWAPYNGSSQVTLLADPVFGDVQSVVGTVDLRKTINDTPYTYVHSADTQKLTLTLDRIGRGKMLEMIKFLEDFADVELKLVTHEDEVWRVRLLTNPLQLSIQYYAGPYFTDGRRNDSGRFTLEFEGTKVSG